MMKKILLLFTVLLLTAGGGQLWADTYTLSFSTKSSADNENPAVFANTDGDYKGGGLTIYGNGRTYPNVSGTKLIKYSAGYTYTISLPDSKSGERIVSVKFEGCANSSDKTSYMSEFNGEGYTETTSPVTFPVNTSSTSYTFSGDAIKSDKNVTFTVSSTQTGLIITVVTEEKTIDQIYNSTYPYTWDFTVEADKWTKSKSEMKASGSGNNWAFSSGGTEARPTMPLNTENSLDDIDIIKGLRFITSDAASLCLDWTNKWMWLNGTVQLPSLSKGHVVTFYSSGAPTNTPSDFTQVSSENGVHVYKATTSGLTPGFVFDQQRITKIDVSKSTLTNFRRGESSDIYISDNGSMNTGDATSSGWLYIKHDNIIGYSEINVTFDNSNISCGELQYVNAEESKVQLTAQSVGSTVMTVSYPGSAGVESSSFTITLNVVEPYTKEFHVEDLRYCPGNGGIKASQMEREVGGYHLSFAGGNGVKCNNYGNFSFQRHSSTNEEGVMTIAMDANNTDKFIRQITLTAWGKEAQTLTPSNVSLSSGILEKTSGGDGNTNEVWTWTSTSDVTSVTFTCVAETAAKFDVYGIAITTLAQPTFTKVTPTLVFPDTESITTSDSKTINLETSSTVTPDNFLFDVSFVDGGTGVTHTNKNSSLGTITATSGNTSAGVASVIASFSGNDFFNSVGSSFSLIVNGENSQSYSFIPNEIYLNLGKNITPYINYSQTDFDASELTFNAYPSDVVSLEPVNHQKENDRKLCKITANGASAEAGKTVVVTAKCKIKDTDPAEYCYATLKVHITAADVRNFDWIGPTEYTINTGDYMFVPGITGNASGNNSYSKASVNAANHSYVYSISNGVIDWWRNKDKELYYKIDEGCPNYKIVENTANTATDKAYIFWVTGQGSSPDTLMVYGNKQGDATLRAFDSQNSDLYTDITIHVVDAKAETGVNTLYDNYVNSMTFPYTWDFTKDFDNSLLAGANPLYWKENGSGSYFMGIASSFDYDFADEDTDGNYTEEINKIFSTGSALIPQLYGLKIALGNSSNKSWYSKINKIRLDPSVGEGKAHFHIIGGTHRLSFPPIPEGTPNCKLLIKAKGNGDKARVIFNGGAASSVDVLFLESGKDKDGNDVSAGQTVNFATKDYEQSGTSSTSNYMKDVIFCYSVSEGEEINLQLNNVALYWIAFSTEEKTLAKFDNTTYWASTYSYQKGLDLNKSNEAFPKVKAYRASEFSGQNTVNMTALENEVPMGTGMLLKATENPGSCYMIASAENSDGDTTPASLSVTNYLKENPAVNDKINANTTIDETQYTNFTLAYRYKVVHAGGNIDSYYTSADDWSFYRIAPGGVTVTNKNLAYLQVPGDLYVYTSRRAGDATDGNPASQELLKIVFDDDNESGEVTGIETVVERNIDSDAWYTLQGVRVNAPAKGGIYIHKGKKVVVK